MLFIAVIFVALLANLQICNAATIKNRIYNGTHVPIEEVPYVAFVAIDRPGGNFRCAGSIIHEKVILTAAHCMGKNPTNETVKVQMRVGTISIYSGGEIRHSEKILIHPEYNFKTLNNDVALVFLSKPIVFNNKTKKIPLAKKDPADGTLATVSGWGQTKTVGLPGTLSKTEVPIVNREVCKEIYAKLNGTITEGMLCTGNLKTGGVGPCKGDSGGPLVVNGEQVGITSFNNDGVCVQKGIPEGYARVSYYREWILEKINQYI